MKLKLFITLFVFTFNTFAQKISLVDSIPMILNKHNTMLVKAIFNETDTLNLNFDTGTTELNLTSNALKNKIKILPKLYNTYYNLKIGNTNYSTKAYDVELAGIGADGNFGWDLFKDKIVELNYDLNLMITHYNIPKKILNNNKYTKLKMEFFKDLFLVECEIRNSGTSNKDFFLFDTGYHKTIMLDNDLLQKAKFPSEKLKFIKKVVMKGAQGNEIPVITSNLENLKLGKFKLKNIPVQLLTTSKPLKDKNTHILGNEVLKRFHVFLDFKNNIVYLKPNNLFKEEYVDQNKNGS